MTVRGIHALGKWSLNPPKGYPRFYSGPLRNHYVSRAVWENIAGKPLPEGWHVHHQDFDKLNFDGRNLLACPHYFNPAFSLRHPWTGRFLSQYEYTRLMEG